MKHEQAKMRVEVGALLWGAVRNLAMEARHKGYQVKLEEGRGWFSRPFFFSGDKPALLAIYRALKRFDENGNDR